MSSLPLRSQAAAPSRETADVQFVDGLAAEGEGRRGTTKQHHKKSRNGCQRCKTRRVKCNEARPACSNCQRHAEACVYDPVISNARGDHHPSIQSSKATSPARDTAEEDRRDLPETRARRLRELSLLHHYNTNTSQLLMTSGDEASELAFVRAVPQQGLKNDALLNAMFAVSALHISESEPENEEIMMTHRKYLALALSEHKADVIKLSETNFDAVVLTSTILRVIAFAMLRDRPLTPYAPPVQWLEMTRGAMNLFEQSWDWVEKDESSMAFKLTKRMPVVFDEEAKFAASNREGFEYLLQRDKVDIETEPWPPDVTEAYETTVSYVGCILIAEKNGESDGEIRRRLLIFSFIVRSRYIELVKEAKPRALAILAHYFAILAQYQKDWWIGESGSREVLALYEALKGKWREFMQWPLQRVGHGTKPVP